MHEFSRLEQNGYLVHMYNHYRLADLVRDDPYDPQLTAVDAY